LGLSLSWTDDSFERFIEYKNSLQKGPQGRGTRSSVPGSFLNQAPGPLSFESDPRSGASRYNLPIVQPSNVITDVDAYNFYSPNQPVAPYGPPTYNRPWEWDYPTSYNLNFIQPQISMMRVLRTMRASWGVLSTIISTCKDQLLSIPYTIQLRNSPKKSDKRVDEIKDFFKRPDGFRNYRSWARLVLDDALVLDTPCLYFPQTLGGKPLAAERIDPITIFPLIDDLGRRPEPDSYHQPAFQQIIKGFPLLNLDASDLMYAPMNPRADLPIFGYPPTEQILRESLEAILKTNYQVSFWDQGTIPELIVTVPDNWSPNQIAVFKAHFDALMSGNLGERTKMHFLPGGMKPFELRNASGQNLWSQRDETLIRVCCYAYSVSPSPFIQMMNRSVAQNAQQASKEEGTFPRMAFWKYDIMDVIIQEKFGYDDIEFVFLPPTEPDGEKREKIFDMQLKNGSRNENEVRAERGEEPIPGGDAYLIHVGNAIVPLEIAAKGGALPAQGGDGSAPNPGSPAGSKSPEKTPDNNPMHGAPRPGGGLAGSTEKAAAGDIDTHSQARLDAGNYTKGHIRLHGLDISIENPRGSFRGKRDNDGTVRWKVRMPAHYGYIRKTQGADNTQVDVFVGKRLDSTKIWVLDQAKRSDPTQFDEHKCFIGFKSLKTVIKTFRKARNDGLRCAVAVSELSIPEFRSWLQDGDTKNPVAGRAGTLVLSPLDLSKLDTISNATNLTTVSTLAKPARRKKGRRSRNFLKDILSDVYGNA
jgi:hypothetical protein